LPPSIKILPGILDVGGEVKKVMKLLNPKIIIEMNIKNKAVNVKEIKGDHFLLIM
jgi:hypothetical protein